MNAERRHGPPTWTEVAMRLVYDVPALAIIVLVGVLAFKGQAESMHVVIAGFGALLSRSFPRAIQVGGGAIAVLFFVAVQLSACAAPPVATLEVERAKGAADVAGYSMALDACKAKMRDVDAGDDAGDVALRAARLRAYETCAKEADRLYGRDGGTP